MKRKWFFASLAAPAVLMALAVGCSSGQTGRSPASGGSASGTTSSSAGGSASASPSSAAASPGESPDYSQNSSWYQVPEITKDVDTFFV